MRRAAAVRGALGLSFFAAISWTSLAGAVVPTGYTGTPYKGTPQAIPGRVNLADMDEGGLNVAFFADHRRENAVGEGYAPISGDDYRAGNLDLPNICKTNRAVEKPGEGSEDFWEDGTRYPSEANPYEYYMGYAHTVDWVRMTVDVKVAGTYNVSSNWACDSDPECGYSIWFNDGSTTKTDNAQKPMDGENKTGTVKFPSTGDYHKWRAYPNQAKVTLAAGVQIMTFHVEVNNHLQYGFVKFDLEGGNPEGGTGGTGGTAAGGTGGAATGGTSATGGTGTGGTDSATGGAAPTTGGTGTPVTGGVPATGTGGAATAGSTSGPVGTSGSAPSGTAGSSAVTGGNATDEGGCAFAPSSTRNTSAAAALAAALALLIKRRRRG